MSDKCAPRGASGVVVPAYGIRREAAYCLNFMAKRTSYCGVGLSVCLLYRK